MCGPFSSRWRPSKFPSACFQLLPRCGFSTCSSELICSDGISHCFRWVHVTCFREGSAHLVAIHSKFQISLHQLGSRQCILGSGRAVPITLYVTISQQLCSHMLISVGVQAAGPCSLLISHFQLDGSARALWPYCEQVSLALHPVMCSPLSST